MKRILWHLRGVACLPWCMWAFSRPTEAYNRWMDDDGNTHPGRLPRRLWMAWVMWQARYVYWMDGTLELWDAVEPGAGRLRGGK